MQRTVHKPSGKSAVKALMPMHPWIHFMAMATTTGTADILLSHRHRHRHHHHYHRHSRRRGRSGRILIFYAKSIRN